MKQPFIWDPQSDQPYVIRDKTFKRRMRAKYFFDYINMLATAVFVLPTAFIYAKILQRCSVRCRGRVKRDFYGIGVNPDKGPAQFNLVDELGIQHVLIRVPLWDLERIEIYRDFAQEFAKRGKRVMINVLQDREHIEDEQRLTQDIELLFKQFHGISDAYQVGNCINRLKWGFFSVEEYLNFYSIVQRVASQSYPEYSLVGPSVIDFEFHYTAHALFNRQNVSFSAASSLLYVDRVGSPAQKQYGLFDARFKIFILSALSRLSAKVLDKRLYITEVNWPLKNTAPYAPTSEKECVTEEAYSQYMAQYLEIVASTNQVQRVYWHQLIAPGYGLVDNRSKNLRKRLAFFTLKEIVANSAS